MDIKFLKPFLSLLKTANPPGCMDKKSFDLYLMENAPQTKCPRTTVLASSLVPYSSEERHLLSYNMHRKGLKKRGQLISERDRRVVRGKFCLTLKCTVNCNKTIPKDNSKISDKQRKTWNIMKYIVHYSQLLFQGFVMDKGKLEESYSIQLVAVNCNSGVL